LEKFKDHKYYKDAIDFCEKWDQKSFNPAYKSLSLKDFAPYVKKIFSRTPYSN
jgi:predicted HD phosphohydrolase